MKRALVCMVAYTDYVFDARVRREAETLASNGFRVICLKTKNGPEPRQYVLNGVEIRELGVQKYQGKSALAYLGSYCRFLVACSAVCVAFVMRGELDVVHVHNLPDFLVFAGFVPRLMGRKVVLDVHDSVPETFATKFSSTSAIWKLACLEERMSARIAHRVICVNHPQKETLVARGIPDAKTFVSMNVPDPAIFQDSCPECQPPRSDDSFNVVYHGTMAARLGVDLLIRAVAALRSRIPTLRLHLWGRGDDLPQFQKLAGDLKVEDIVLFNPKGFPLEQLPGQLANMNVGLVGNRSSTATDLMLPVKLIEYVSLGIPAVVPRLRTIRHYFTDDMVTFYEPEDVRSLADSIQRLYCQPDLRAAQAKRAKAFLKEYGWERQGPELVTFYRSLVEN